MGQRTTNERGRIVLIAMEIVAAFSSCGSGTGKDQLALTSASAFCTERAARATAREGQCFGASFLDETVDAPDCASLDGLLAKGTLAFDKNMAAACVTAWDAAGPVDQAAEATCFLPDCRSPITGLVPDGQPCVLGECAPNSRCMRVDGFTCAPRICIPKGELGAACTRSGCVPGTACVDSHCAIWTPSPSTAVPGGPCDADAKCVLTEWCKQGQCAPRARLGESCVTSSCVIFSRCDPATAKCVAAGHDGEPCGWSYLCISGSCLQGPTPDQDRCGQAHSRKLGSACNVGDDCLSGYCPVGACQTCGP